MYAPRILVLAPHPDDEIVGCCAAMARARSEGCRVSVLFLSTGVARQEVHWPWRRHRHPSIVARRWEEADRAAALLGFSIAGRWDLPSRTLKEHLEEGLGRIRQALQETRADHLWTPGYEGGHQDHDAACFLASRLSGRLPVWEYSNYHFADGKVHSQEFGERTGEEKTLRLEAEEVRLKRRALALYASEAGNLAHISIRQEMFRPLALYDFNRPPHSGKLFYQRFQWMPRHPRVDYCRPEQVIQAFREFQRQSAKAT